MNSISILQGKEHCPHCLLTPVTAGDYLAFYLCNATVGEDGFSRNPDCLAAAALRQMGVLVNNFPDLTKNFSWLKGRG